ncbi:MAG: prepilin peptidase [Bifidobacteriaceae bacterium]|jgi:leader peptidase (prepilin peptidase)/N-methyltransferase|nr:prepilin peptidase [Bifidobacteriaceae bacterium]
MNALLLVLAGLTGLVVGSFLGVVIVRVPGGASLWPRSACPACQTLISARDNLPVVSWLVLRGRCRSCATAIPWRYPAVEVSTAALFVGVAAWLGWSWALPAFAYLAAVCLALTVIDWRVRRLPNAIVLPSYPILVALLTLAAAMSGDWGALARALIGGVILSAFYWTVCLVVPRGMGLGDAKLSGICGMGLAWVGWGPFALGVLAPFALGAAFGVATMIAQRTGRGTSIPFGPWMCAGTAIGCVAGPTLWTAYGTAVGL